MRKKKNVLLKDGPHGQDVQIGVVQESGYENGNVGVTLMSIATILFMPSRDKIVSLMTFVTLIAFLQ